MWTKSSQKTIIPERKGERWKEGGKTGYSTTPHPNPFREKEIQEGIKVTGLKKKERERETRGVISTLKIASLPSFLSPGNSLHRECENLV